MAQQYIGVTLPLRRGNTGYFEQSTTVFQQIKSNFRNLILTRKGDRLMQPEFGTDIHNILFEQITEETIDVAKMSINESVERWMPFLEVIDFQITTPSERNPNRINIFVQYRFRSNPNVTDSITVSI